MPFDFQSMLPKPAPTPFPQPGQVAQQTAAFQKALPQQPPLPGVAAPKVDTNPIWSQQQIAQQQNQTMADTEAKLKNFQLGVQRQNAGRGISSASPAAQRQFGQQYALGVGQANAANQQLAWNAAQGNAQHVLAAQGKAGELSNQAEAQNTARGVAGLQATTQQQQLAAQLAQLESAQRQQSAMSSQEFGQQGILSQEALQQEMQRLQAQLGVQKELQTQSLGATAEQNAAQRQLQAWLSQQGITGDLARQYMAGVQSYANQGLQSRSQLSAAQLAAQASMANNQTQALAQLQQQAMQNAFSGQAMQYQANTLPLSDIARYAIQAQQNQIAAHAYNPDLLTWQAQNDLRNRMIQLASQNYPAITAPGGVGMNNFAALMAGINLQAPAPF